MEIEGIYLFNKNKELIDVFQPSQLTENSQDWTLNGLIKGSVRGVYTDSIEQAQYYGTRDVDEANVFWMYKIINYTKQDNLFNIDGIYVLFDDLSGRGVIRDRRPKNAPIRDVLGYILEDTGWEIGQVYSSHKGTSNYYYVSKLEAFWDFLSKWRVEFEPRMTFSNGKITGKYIDVYDRLSDDFGKWYEYGDTLLTVEAEEMRENVFTAFIGRGKGEEVGEGFGRKIGFDEVVWSKSSSFPVDKPLGQDYVEIGWATELYGYEDGTPRTTIVDFPDVDDPEELLLSTYEYGLTECRPKVQFKANVLETGRTDIGETVTIIRNDIGIRYKTRVFNNKRNFLNGAIKTIKFGEQLVHSTSQTAKQTAAAIKKQEEQTLDWLLVLRQAISDSYFNEDGYNYELGAGNEYGLPGGYYSFNKPIDQNPSKVVYVGAGKVLLANSQNPDGSWIWRTAMDGDGIVADEINTGRLKASLIQAGFNDISDGFGVIITEDGMYSGSPSGEYTLLEEGGMKFFTRDDVLNGSIESSYAGDQTGVGVFIEPHHGFSVTRNNPKGTPNKTVFQVPNDVDELKINAPFNANGQKINDASTISAFDFRVKGTNQRIANIVGGGGAYFDTMKVSLGVGGDDGVSMKLTALPDRVMVNTLLDLGGNDLYNVLNIRPSNNGRESWYFTTGAGEAMLAGRYGTALGAHDGTSASTKLKIPHTGAMVAYTDLNMNGKAITNQSDMRLKKKVSDTSMDALKQIDKMKFVDYEWDLDNPFNEGKEQGKRFGQLAQYTPTMLQCMNGEKDHYLSINQTMQVDLNSKAIQELHQENKELKQELADLKTLLTEKGLI